MENESFISKLPIFLLAQGQRRLLPAWRRRSMGSRARISALTVFIFIMNRRKVIKLILLGSASVTSLISTQWLDRIKSTDVAYLYDKQSLIAELAEVIIPETDTPGAKAVKVDEFIIRMLTDCTDSRSLNNFLMGIQELEEYCYVTYRRPFIRCTAGQKEAILKEFENRASPYQGILGKIENKILGRSFFSLLKAYTVMGFCTSQLGATRALKYEGIPGRYENVVSMGPMQRSWATK